MSRYFVTCARGVEPITAEELRGIGVTNLEEVPGGVFFEGDQDTLYKAHLWLRTGNRILLPLRSFPCHTPEQLYEGVSKTKWETFFKRDLTFSVDCTLSGRRNPKLDHSQYAKLKAKDAIVDRMRAKTGDRPNVDIENPDIGIFLYVRDGVCTLNLDATGASLHERGYRSRDARAPLKETLAAALLILAEYDPTKPLIDPMCGSGTILTEAALIATNTAPGLLRRKFLFMNWPDYYAPRWEKWSAEARDAQKELPPGLLFGFDSDPKALKQTVNAFENLRLPPPGLERRTFEEFEVPEGLEPGLLLVNPPYGERIGEVEELKPMYKFMGDTFKHKLKGWRAGIFTGNMELGKSVGLKSSRKFPLYNGPIECRLFTYEMY